MGRKINRSFIFILICSGAGVVLGGTASWAESNQCWQTNTPTSQCLAQSPVSKTIEGMSIGLVAGVTAAIGATWQLRQED